MTMPPNTARGCVKSADMKFSNDQIFDMANFGESSRWMGWLKNEFSHSLSPEPTAIGAVHQIETRPGSLTSFQQKSIHEHHQSKNRQCCDILPWHRLVFCHNLFY